MNDSSSRTDENLPDAAGQADGTCVCLDNLIIDYLDDRLSPTEEARLSEHLKHCPACRAQLELQQGWLVHRAVLRARREAIAAPPELTARLQREIARESGRADARETDRVTAREASRAKARESARDTARESVRVKIRGSVASAADSPAPHHAAPARAARSIRWQVWASAAAMVVVLLIGALVYRQWSFHLPSRATRPVDDQGVSINMDTAAGAPEWTAAMETTAASAVKGTDESHVMTAWRLYDGPLADVPGASCLLAGSDNIITPPDSTVNSQSATSAGQVTTQDGSVAATEQGLPTEPTVSTGISTSTGIDASTGADASQFLNTGVLAQAARVLVLARSAAEPPPDRVPSSSLDSYSASQPHFLILAAYPADQLAVQASMIRDRLVVCALSASVTMIDELDRQLALQSLIGPALYEQVQTDLPDPDLLWISIEIG